MSITDAMIGRWVLDQYVVRAKLGEGVMGAVYLADQPAIARQAVIKVIHPWLSSDPGLAGRFMAEAKAASRLQNPHIASIYNYGRMPDGTLFVAMEHLTGRTLAQLLQTGGRLDATRAVGITTQVCEALNHAHTRGVIHRDLRPSNIMLVARDRGPEFVKVLDFGIAKPVGFEGVDRASAKPSSAQYLSPEQISGQPVTASSDVYSLGLVLYEMLTGRAAFVAESAAGYAHTHLHESPLPLAQACPGLRVVPALEACLMRAMAKAPHHRPQGAGLFADELWSALMATVESSQVPTPRLKSPPPKASAVAGAVFVGVLVLGGLAAATHFAVRPTLWVDANDMSRASETSSAAPGATPASVPASPVSPEQAALLAKSVSALEAEFQRAIVLSDQPRDRIDLAMREYQTTVANPPADRDATAFRKAVLVELIVSWRRRRAEVAPTDRRLDELEAIFLTMPSSYSPAARKQLLLQLETPTPGETDADQRVYRRLIAWIADYGESDEPIEIINDDQPD